MSKEAKNFLISVILAAVMLFIVVLFWENYLLSIILLAVIGFLLIAVESSWDAVLLYCTVFLAGPIGEAIVIYFGAWSYSVPQFMGITAWLPFLWGNAALLIRQVDKFINYILKNKK